MNQNNLSSAQTPHAPSDAPTESPALIVKPVGDDDFTDGSFSTWPKDSEGVEGLINP